MKRIALYCTAFLFLFNTAVFGQRNNMQIMQQMQGGMQQQVRERVMTIVKDTLAQKMEELQKLKFTPEQQKKITELREEWNKQRIRIEADKKIAQIELNQLLRDSTSTEAKIKAQLDKIAQSDVSLRLGGIKLDRSIEKLLTPEQKEIYNRRKAGQRLPNQPNPQRNAPNLPGAGRGMMMRGNQPMNQQMGIGMRTPQMNRPGGRGMMQDPGKGPGMMMRGRGGDPAGSNRFGRQADIRIRIKRD